MKPLWKATLKPTRLLLVALAALARTASSADGGAWEYYYPGKYDAQDATVLARFRADLAAVTNIAGKIDIGGVVSGRLINANTPSVSWNPMENNFLITRDSMLKHAHMYLNDNPLFSDDTYARNAGYQGSIAFPLLFTNECMPAMPKSAGIGDYFVVSSHNDVVTYYRPIRAGDRLYTIYTERDVTDITPAAGSHHRTFALSGSCKVYNQNAELVAEGANILKESFRRHADPARRNPDGAHAWESPDWWQRKAHVYTDADWQTLIAAWRSEARRGGVPLYWDDVTVGTTIGPRYSSPIISDVETDMMFEVPQFAVDIKRQVLDAEIFPKMVRNAQGIYVLPENLTKKPAPRPFSGAGRDTDTRTQMRTPEIANRDGRATIQNAVLPKYVAGMIYDWMGDHGWLQRIGWDIMWTIPGYDESVIPPIPSILYPALFDKFPVFDRVPQMKAKGATTSWHALEGDIIVSRAYVTGKYRQNGDYLVDLSWWCETFDGYLVERGFATVRLPRKS
jgi:acyl dehydratase